jgi:hypothetical protein
LCADRPGLLGDHLMNGVWRVLLSQLNDGVAIVRSPIPVRICLENEEILWPHGALTKSSW